ncbi:TetM/TetW/TetO/TetS family tetracycline resistance ribosomal protection protein [Paenibacillus sp. MBLB2552]|uniref:TetM/TetW/TetO/TetS family tetracycline resistance ribosomal protection protein n=1 Tax=Paenibacillus mellifer TaxID=2937794 RepID=A0A9X1Y3N2_9BACL|nr:TetM/TetW/TetO/TetS family tetracycline resistance ribosomal protection protein [Paenibacillus mellifer]MCK8486742.1 TetM/TetW/TetO/TetS family tetracycline resistance ribosomal protection protein [Paenibacillus mellifer]
MYKTIGLLAHVDAGKTTFAEALLYQTQTIRSRGRVDHRDAFLDSHEIEKARGITVFADQAEMRYGESTYFLLDTPGHVDFSAEMERALQVLDYAVIIVSAVEGVEGHTETVWQLLRTYGIPTFFFINKTDRTGADPDLVFQDLIRELSGDVLDVSSWVESGRMDDTQKAWLAEREEALLEVFLEGTGSVEEWNAHLARLIQSGQVYPCLRGSALLDIGIDTFLHALERLTRTTFNPQISFAGRVYKIRHDEQGTRITFIKALQGTLKVRDEIAFGPAVEGARRSEKITGIRKYSGQRFVQTDSVTAGELFAVTGLTEAHSGEAVGAFQDPIRRELVPTLQSKVLFEPPLHLKEVLRVFRLLDAEDPTLGTRWDEALQELHIHVMGRIQLEILQQVLLERFRMNIAFGPPEILYKETIIAPVVGCGHFEPLGHYAEVHLRLEPGERGSGVTFVNACHADDLTVGYQNMIGQHVLEQEHHGLLTGSPLTDVRVTLLTGRSHNKHTSGGDFREATYRALRQGLEQTENVLLEPVYLFKIKVGLDQLGKVLTDIQQAHGRFDSPETGLETAVITGVVPVATFMDYGAELASMSHGKGSITLKSGGYEPCHQTDTVIARKNYNKDADPAYTSSSIFCSKGQAYSVSWEEVKNKMHASVD